MTASNEFINGRDVFVVLPTGSRNFLHKKAIRSKELIHMFLALVIEDPHAMHTLQSYQPYCNIKLHEFRYAMKIIAFQWHQYIRDCYQTLALLTRVRLLCSSGRLWTEILQIKHVMFKT